MKNKPLVSIVTPCFNGEDFLYKYFESIEGQTYKNIELIFVDDGSTDHTKDIALQSGEKIKTQGMIFKYIYQKHSGQAHAINTGLKYVRGKYIIWPDSDDILDKTSIEKRTEFMERNPEYSMVRSNGDYFEYETGKKICRISNAENRFKADIFEDLIMERTFCACGCYMLRVEKLKDIYPDMTIFESPAGQNWQLIIPLAGNGFCGYIDEDLYHIADRKNSHSRKERTESEQIRRLLDLKEILFKSVEISGRYDKDYPKMIENKYNRLLFRTYIELSNQSKAQEYMKIIKNTGNVDEYSVNQYLRKFHPIRFKICEMLRILEHIINKLRRWIGER